MDGIQDGKKSISKFYMNYDEKFPALDELKRKFEELMYLIDELLIGEIPQTIYKGVPWFYTLFTALADIKYGIPKGHTKNHFSLKNTKQHFLLKESLINISQRLMKNEKSKSLLKVFEAGKSTTHSIKSRVIRHNYIVNELINTLSI